MVRIYIRYFSPLFSYMAMNGLDDIYEGGLAITDEAMAYFTRRAAFMGLPFDEYVRRPPAFE